MTYPTKEGKHGTTYLVAKGVKVSQTKYGTYQLCIGRKGHPRQRKNFSEEDGGLKRALEVAGIAAIKMGAEWHEDEERRTFNDIYEMWVKFNQRSWAEGTLLRYNQLAKKYILPKIGNMPIDALTRVYLRGFLADFLNESTCNTTRIAHNIISGSFNEAIERGLIATNPASGLRKKVLPPKHKRVQEEADPFSKEELRIFLDTAWSMRNKPLALLLETLAYTGMRIGEGLAMHVDNLDIRNEQYKIKEAYITRLYKMSKPKTGSRIIDLPRSLVGKLEGRILDLRKQALKGGSEVGYIFQRVG